MLTDWAVAYAWTEAGLPIVGVGTLHIDDILLMFSEGMGAYWMHTKNQKEIRNFLIGMFSATLMIEVGEAVMQYLHPTAAVARAAPAPVRYVVTS